MDSLVQRLKAIGERLIHLADSVKLSVVGSHHCAVVTDKRLCVLAVVLKVLAVKRALLLNRCGCGLGAFDEGTASVEPASSF
jgi:hypothetical protein